MKRAETLKAKLDALVAVTQRPSRHSTAGKRLFEETEQIRRQMPELAADDEVMQPVEELTQSNPHTCS